MPKLLSLKTFVYTFVISSFFLLNSCMKEPMKDGQEVKVDLKAKDFEGDFIFSVSNSDEEDGYTEQPLYSLTPSDVGHNYAFRIKKSGKCYFFEDEDMVDKGEVSSAFKKTTYYEFGDDIVQYTVVINWDDLNDMSFSGSTKVKLVLKTFPVDSLQNIFIKKIE